ncbi:MAG: hypothetical protein QM496_19475 [Verrucomicrobiota bacterium]
MLEVILIIFLCNKMGSILRTKGWEKTFWMQFLVVVVYLGSLFAGSFVYVIYVAITQGETALDGLGIVLYLAAYVGVLIGVGALFLSAKLIKNKTTPLVVSKKQVPNKMSITNA